jgi:hypothetical protein
VRKGRRDRDEAAEVDELVEQCLVDELRGVLLWLVVAVQALKVEALSDLAR